MEQLTSEGYVEKRSGIGTIVLDNAAVITMSTGQSFTNHLMKEGKTLVKNVLSLSTNQVPPAFMQIDSTNPSFTRIERIYYLDKQPYIHMTHYIPSHIVVPTDPVLYETSLYDVLNQMGIQFDRFSDEFQVATPPVNVSTELQIEQVPLLLRSRYAYDTDGSLIEYSIAYYETNMHSYVINFNV
ncbi:GntR family transcriptional regulator [Bacillus sp. JCM 19041]|uniref:GntR family transcriptional regulator n=1 Tax=Bacillus sp. JCM 19041 TaxID=1460637 RepID=UPI000A61A262